jgi:tetratricopeptide (TPR) repeat protein
MRNLSTILVSASLICLLSSSLAFGETKKNRKPDKFPPSPLELKISDPLIPTNTNQVTDSDRLKLETAMAELNQQAIIQLQSGNPKAAYEIWYRELRLRRSLGTISELEGLARVGAIAWGQNSKENVFYITQRLDKIQKETKKNPDPDTLEALGFAYRQVRAPKQAIETYNKLLTDLRSANNQEAELKTLQTLAELYLSYFDYQKAAESYEQLLALPTVKGLASVNYLQQLAYIYKQSKQYDKSVEVRNKLVEIYQTQNDPLQVTTLKLAIAADYQAQAKDNPNLLPEVYQRYEDAYQTAWKLQQYTRASEALEKLMGLYRTQGKIDEALEIGLILLQSQRLAVNAYGMMNAFDQVGLIYLQRNSYPQALEAFQKGLQIAKMLNFKEDYFSKQVESVQEKI